MTSALEALRAAPDAIGAGSITITGHGGDAIEAYVAAPLGPGPYGGVVVIHHMPGFDRESKEITRTFAARGYLAACPNLFHRYAPGAASADGSAAARAAGGVPDDQAMGDVGGAVAWIRAQDASNGRVGVIGYCSGGRQAYLAACLLDIDAAVDCYGGNVVMPPDQLTPARPVAPIDLTAKMGCPLLGLFGADDTNPSPEHVARMRQELEAHGKTFELHSYDGTGHAFFSVDRPNFRLDSAKDGWKKVWSFFGTHLARPA